MSDKRDGAGAGEPSAIPGDAGKRPARRTRPPRAKTGAPQSGAAPSPSTPLVAAAPVDMPKPSRRATTRVSARGEPLPTPSVPGDVPSGLILSATASAQKIAPARARRPPAPRRARESGVLGLAERARLLSQRHGFNLLPDPLMLSLPTIRHALLNLALEDGVRAVVESLASTLAPAVAQCWIADPAPWTPESGRVGGQELLPALRLRATARAGAAGAVASLGSESLPGGSFSRGVAHADPLLAEVLATRHPVVMYDAADNPLAQDWTPLMPDAGPALPAQPGAEAWHAPVALGTLAAYPLRARGQFLGVLALGTELHLQQRQVAAIEELADLAALAADRDRLLSYSRSQEALAQTVVRHAPVAMAVLSGPDHVFALSNPTFASLLGVESAPNIIGKRLAEVVPDRAQSFATSLRLTAVYEGGEPQAMIELPIHIERGMTYWNVTTSPLPGISTTVGGVLIAAVEVTRQVVARHRAQDSAEIAQERIGQMMTLHATSLAVASQLGADPHELLVDILRRSVALLNAQAGAVYVRDAHTNELEVILCQGLRGDYIGKRIRVGDGLAGEVARTRTGLIVDDYRAYPFRAAIYADEAFSAIIAVPLIHHGQVVGVLDVLDDANRRTFTDDDLWLLDLFAAQAAQAIENARTYVELEHAYRKQRELDRMKDDFIATASHELRTPLTGVQGFLDLLLDYNGSRDDTLALDFLQRASDSAQELAEISERLLQTSRLDTGRLEVHSTPVRLAQVVAEVLRSYRELQAAQGTTHELTAEVARDIYAQADLSRLKEVLDNLVGNAIKYSPQGGRVHVRCVAASDLLAELTPPARPDLSQLRADDLHDLHDVHDIEDSPTIVLKHLGRDFLAAYEQSAGERTPLVSLLSTAPGNYYVLLVSDQGMGIPPEERPRLFGRFSRLEAARASQIRGTGLGLYICRQIMQALGGDVWLHESAPGVGTTFAFALPAATGSSIDDSSEFAAAHSVNGRAGADQRADLADRAHG